MDNFELILEHLVKTFIVITAMMAVFFLLSEATHKALEEETTAKKEIEKVVEEERAKKEEYKKHIEHENPGNFVELAITPPYNNGSVKYIFHVIKDGKVIKKVYVSNDGVLTEEEI
ncbi:hypothetical protein [Paenibacillus chitinolyticus]|uniref:hypothetical protein n=1 Tax=Paenibacillus chitinolyticus TaxID=79263 RepID=UPI00295EE07D|nr:hypothetical protein [Paenibacillus chitinolyticus]